MVQSKLTPPLPQRFWLPEMLFRLAGRRAIRRVTGASMSPSIRNGECVVVDCSIGATGSLRPGDIVLARHPYRRDREIVKRIGSFDADGGVALYGDNADGSTDSRTFGTVDRERIVGKVIARTEIPI